MFLKTLSFCLFVGASLAQTNSPYEKGPYQTAFHEIWTVNIENDDHNLGVHAPVDAGNLPVIDASLGFFGKPIILLKVHWIT